MTVTRRTQEDRSNATRRALIEASAPLFAERGYGSVTLDQITEAAGVTRGALYHHYEDKAALFRAVFEELASHFHDELTDLLARKRSATSRIHALLDAYLDVCLDPKVRRIALLDGPAVLGFEQWRELQREYFLGLLVEQLVEADAEHKIAGPPAILAPIFFAIAMESSLLIAEAKDPAATRRQTRGALRKMLEAAVPPVR